jgi:lipopolysaccharide transport system ATP-binding protein
VGSLLEVGTGFHPELTGRENIYLNGAILGMKRTKIESKFDEIVAFAEVEKFIDTPVKHYSSGMYLRLAFAVAAHLEPEILLVDEVLAVGDAAFQKKCLGKMGGIAAEGSTVLFVSHNMTALRSLCSRAIWLWEGHLKEQGDVNAVVSHYLQRSAEARTESVWPDHVSAPGNRQVRLQRVRIGCAADNRWGQITVETPFEIEVTYWTFEPHLVLNVSLVLYNIEDVCIFNVASEACPRPAGVIRQVCQVPGCLLNDTVYRVRVLIVRDTSRAIVDIPDAGRFEVHDVPREGSWYGKWIGSVRPKLRWTAEVISPLSEWSS